MSEVKNRIFISCGQYTDDEKELGKEIQNLIRELTPCEPYFAEFQNSLEGLSNNIFKALYESSGFITVLQDRGVVHPPGKESRASVWIEQEIAIAAFIQSVLRKDLNVIALSEKGIALEGVRQQLILNPRVFSSNEEAIDILREVLPKWQHIPKEKNQLLIELEYVVKGTSKILHTYDFVVTVKNNGDEVVDDYYVDLEFPREAMLKHKFLHEVEERSTKAHRFMRAPIEKQREPIFPGDKLSILRFQYNMNEKNFSNNELMNSVIRAKLFERGHKPISVEKAFRSFQEF